MNLFLIDSLFTATLGLKLSVSSSGTKQDAFPIVATISFWFAFAIAIMFSPHFSSVQVGRQQM